MKRTTLRSALTLGAAIFALAPVTTAQQPAATAAPANTAVAAPAAPAEATRITIDEVRKRTDAKEKITIVDARSSITGDMIKGAQHVTFNDVETWAKNVPKDTFIVAYCSCPTEGTSMAFANRLKAMGYTNVYALKGGIQGWQAAGLPTQPFSEGK